jgi:endonuclease-3
MNKKELYQYVIDFFQKTMPIAETELVYKTPFQLIVSVILSAQCTDVRVNKITPFFFEKFSDATQLKDATFEEVFDLIKTCSYPNNKAKHLIAMSNVLVKKFNNIVPQDIDLLQQMPGVGRKTANVIASVLYNLPTLAVDTHVYRVSARLGLTINSKNPLQTEKQLLENISEELRPIAHHWLILHGRYTCLARKPKCNICGLNQVCKYYLDSKVII